MLYIFQRGRYTTNRITNVYELNMTHLGFTSVFVFLFGRSWTNRLCHWGDSCPPLCCLTRFLRLCGELKRQKTIQLLIAGIRYPFISNNCWCNLPCFQLRIFLCLQVFADKVCPEIEYTRNQMVRMNWND